MKPVGWRVEFFIWKMIVPGFAGNSVNYLNKRVPPPCRINGHTGYERYRMFSVGTYAFEIPAFEISAPAPAAPEIFLILHIYNSCLKMNRIVIFEINFEKYWLNTANALANDIFML